MKLKNFCLLAILVCAFSAQAAIKGQPFLPEEDARFDAVEGNVVANSASGLHQKQIAVAHYTFAGNGIGSASVVTLPVTLPAGAVVVRNYFYSKTALVGPTNVAFSCQTANNLYSSAAVASFGTASVVEGVATGAATAFQKITTACPVKMTYTVAAPSAGDITAYIEYVVHN